MDSECNARCDPVSGPDFFGRRGSIPKIGYAPDLVEAAFGLSEADRYPNKVYETDKGAYVIRWEAKQGIDMKKYEEEKEKYRFSLMQARQESLFQAWLENLRNKAKIQIVTPVES